MSKKSFTKTSEKVILLGAGLVGSLLSILLAKKGYDVAVYEKRPDFRKTTAEAGRSINLALSRRGRKALALAGIEEKIEAMILPMNGRMMHSTKGNLTFQPYGKEGQAIYSISRENLNALLIDEAENSGVKIYFDQRCNDVDLPGATVLLESTMNFERLAVTADMIIGADGAFSALRDAMRKTDRFNYSQYFIAHGYKELTIPTTSENDFALAPHALHIWPRGQYMLIALPNLDKSFTCTLFFPFEGSYSFASLKTAEEVTDFFKKTFPDVVSLMPTLTNDYFNNPTSSLVTISCYPWVKYDKNVLLGDAAHALVPFYGQGMNAGFEDCRIFMELLEKHHGNRATFLNEFQQSRKPDADAISELALQNFIEMRDLVANPQFLLRKKIEAKLHQLYPEKWIPEYSMVTFSDMHYSEALAMGKKQQKIMDEVMATANIERKWENLDYQAICQKLID